MTTAFFYLHLSIRPDVSEGIEDMSDFVARKLFRLVIRSVNTPETVNLLSFHIKNVTNQFVK